MPHASAPTPFTTRVRHPRDRADRADRAPRGHRVRRIVSGILAAMLVSIGLVPLPAAFADGIPDVTLSVTSPATALRGGTFPVTLSATNPTATSAYNASFRLVLPAGASLHSASPGATTVGPRIDGTTAVIWSNVSDLLAGTTSAVTAVVDTGTLPLGPLTVLADVQVHDQARYLPGYTPTGDPVPGSFTGWASGSSATELVPFTITTDVVRPENELVRGVHDQKTVVTVEVEENFLGPSSGVQVEQYLPATLEYLACGDVDNSTGPEEYPGAGHIDDTAAPGLPAPCLEPTTVETLSVDPPGSQPLGLYTVLRWDVATLATMGWDVLATGGGFTFAYVVGVPALANVAFPGGTAVDGIQGANLDNNTGAATLEPATEQAATITGAMSGTYQAIVYGADGTETVTLEDLAIQKSVDTGLITQGGDAAWRLDLQVSEYTTDATGIVVTDTLPDGLCPFGAGDPECPGGTAPSPGYTSATENADGSWTLVWDLGDRVANDTEWITFVTRARAFYQEGGANADPVRAMDSWTNTVGVTGTAAEVGWPVRVVSDTSSAGQSATAISLVKQVAAPDAAGDCVEGLAWETGASTTAFGPGDVVCWLLTANTPSGLDTTGLELADFLPAGFAYEGSAATSASDVGIASTDTVPGSRRIDWTFTGGGNLDENSRAQVLVTSRVVDPTAAEDGVVLGNLAKLRYANTDGEPFQLRSEALAPWQEPVLTLDKSAAPPVWVTDAWFVTYDVTVTNTGGAAAEAIEVWDLLPPQLDCTDLVPATLTPGFTCSAGSPSRISGTFAGPVAAGGGTASLSYQVKLPVDLAPSEQLTNHAGVRTFQEPTNDPGAPFFVYVPAANIDPTLTTPNTTAADDTAQVQLPAVGMAKTSTSAIDIAGDNTAGQATIGEEVTYTVRVTLPRNTTLTEAVLTDPVPGQLVYVADSAAVTLDAGPATGFTLEGATSPVRVRFPDSYLVGATDQVLELTLRAVVGNVSTALAGTNVTNTATLTYEDAGGTPLPNRTASTVTRIVEPRIGVTKTESDVDNTATPGERIPFRVRVTNTGASTSSPWTSTAHDVTVLDTIPTSMTPVVDGFSQVVPAGPYVGTWDPGTRQITWTIPSMTPGSAVNLDYEVDVADPIVAPTTFANTAMVTTTSLPGVVAGERTSGGFNPSRYGAVSTVTLNGPRPSVTKSVTPATAAVGEAVTYTVTATIPPSVGTFDAAVLDTLPAGMTYLAGSASAACSAPIGCDILLITELTPNGQRLGWFLGDLADADDPRVVTITYQAVVADVPAVTSGAVLANAALIGFNNTDQADLDGTSTPPPVASYQGTSAAVHADVTVVEPVLALTKTVALGAAQVPARRVRPGEVVTYSIGVTNTGSGIAHDVLVSDVVDSRMTAASVVDGPGWTVTDGDPSDGSLAFEVPAIAVGSTVTITYQLQVPALTSADEVAGPELINTADATYTSALVGSPGPVRAYDDVPTDTVGLEADVATMGDLVWFDTDGDGTRGAGEPGVSGATVTVSFAGADGTFGTGDDETRTTTTAADGTWLVSELPGGAYRVSVSGLPADAVVTTDLTGTPAAGGPVPLTLDEDADRRDVDFGIRGTGLIGDLVWLDLDADGVTDSGEPGLSGIGVDVLWFGPDGVAGTADDVAFAAVTGALGGWSVTGVPAGMIAVSLSSTPAGLVPASDPDGERGAAADSASESVLGAAATDLSLDFGLRGTGLIGDRLWVDLDADGAPDGGEPGIPGGQVDVLWYGLDGVPGTGDDAVVTVTAGADGAYQVTALPPGDYDVVVSSLPLALAPTFDEDSGTTTADGRTSLTLADGAEHRTADFGFVAVTGVGDRVWLDLDRDGVQDAGEPGLPGVSLEVTSAGSNGTLGDADDITVTTTTAAGGAWLVTGLPAGPTRVTVTGGLPTGVTPSFDADGIGTPAVSEVVLADMATDRDQDFGFAGPNAIGDRAWVDVDADGVQDAAEPGLGGLTVEVTWLGMDGAPGGGDDLVIQTATGADGGYLVTGLPDGDHVVAVVAGVPAGYTPTWDETGSADAVSEVLGLGADGPEVHRTADFGFGGTGALGGTVWLDRDADGVLDAPSEAGLPGIGVVVTWAGPDDAAGTADDVTIRTETVAGEWEVTGLPPGTYTAVVDPATVPAGTVVVFDRQHGTTTPDGTWTGTLDPAQVRLDVDTGLRGGGSIGDLVWLDSDRDGTRDPGEHGTADVRVVVTWLGSDGAAGGGDDVTVEVRTGPDGSYVVDGLPAGRFTVSFDAETLPPRTSAAGDLAGPNPLITSVTLAINEARGGVDLRLVPPPSLLPTTGMAVGGLLLLALLLVAAGLGLTRRRSSFA